uniref:glucuronosyltransferase n=1 Tax=Parastrongyloides trichosuri TaxID=131310 RepID=A0A0N5A5P4_PARTI
MFLINLITIFLLINYVISLKILINNPKFGYSHVNFFSRVADILVEAGHDVTVLAIEMDTTVKHKGAMKAKIFDVKGDDEAIRLLSDKSKMHQMWENDDDLFKKVELFKDFTKGIQLTGVKVFHDKELENFVKSQNFDVAISEWYTVYMFGLFKAWGIKTTISASSVGFLNLNYAPFGMHFSSSYIPNGFQLSTDKMSYFERAENLFGHILIRYAVDRNNDKAFMKEFFDAKYGEGFFQGDRALGDSCYFLANSNPFFDIPVPKPPKVIEISGIGIEKGKMLNEYWDKILSLREKTVLISFGSVAKSSLMPLKMKENIVETITKFSNVTFIWKYETPEDGTIKKIDNLILSKWTPQYDMLYDGRLSLFITHGGINSLNEIVYTGSVALSIPIFGDQFKNSMLLEKRKIGISMNRKDLMNSNVLFKNINELLHNDVYKNNSKVISSMLKNNPVNSTETLIRHVEFCGKFSNNSFLDLESRNMGVIVFYNLDIIIPLIIILMSLFILILLFVIEKGKKLIFIKKKTD